MAAPHNLCWNPLFSHQMICKQYIILNHMFFWYESNLEIRTCYSNKQECIPLGCIPSAAVAISGGGVSAYGGVRPGGCLPRGCVCPGRCLPMGCVCLEGMCIPACNGADTPVNRVPDTCLWKHYLSATTVSDGNNRIVVPLKSPTRNPGCTTADTAVMKMLHHG